MGGGHLIVSSEHIFLSLHKNHEPRQDGTGKRRWHYSIMPYHTSLQTNQKKVSGHGEGKEAKNSVVLCQKMNKIIQKEAG